MPKYPLIKLRKLNIIVGANGSGKSEWAKHLDPQVLQSENRIDPCLKMLRNGAEVSTLIPLLLPRVVYDYLFMFDKPETNLHPRLHHDLADLFVGAVMTNRLAQFIIETHSEPLISRLGEMVFEGKLDRADCQVILFHLHKDGVYEIRSTEFDQEGMLSEWPPGFLS